LIAIPETVVERMADVSPSAFALYIFFIHKADSEGNVLIAQKEICALTGISYSHISRLKTELVAKEWIVVNGRVVTTILGFEKFAENANKFAENARFEIKKIASLYNNNNINNNIYNKYINNKYSNDNNKTISEVSKKMTKKGKRLPDDFEVTQTMLDWAAEKRLSVDLDIETEKFRNYWVSVPGAKGVKLDWVATWRNWMLNAEGYQRRGNGGYQKAPSTNRERLEAYGSVFAKYQADPEE
jgi:hypothetical protein